MEKLCRELDVEYRRCGSMVLAFSAEETATLKTLCDRGIKNGVKELRLLSGEEARTMEPALAETVRVRWLRLPPLSIHGDCALLRLKRLCATARS